MSSIDCRMQLVNLVGLFCLFLFVFIFIFLGLVGNAASDKDVALPVVLLVYNGRLDGYWH